MTPDQYVDLRDRIALLKARTTTLLLRKANDNTFKPPSSVQSAARRGLELREKWKRGGLDNSEASSQGIGSGVQRAVNLKNGDAISLATVKRMAAFFSRHQKNYRPDKKEPDGGPTAGTIAWLLWGGNAGKSWANGIVNRADVQKGDAKAPPEDRIHGSDKNPKGSASSGGGGIELTDAIVSSLQSKVEEHNKGAEHKATLGMLKAVYRRGTGAFSTSHRPGVSRNAWAMARVNAFLRLLRTGSPENSAYVTDNDLLPKGHPKASGVKKANAGYTPRTGWEPNDGKPEPMAYAKEGDGAPAGGPDAGDVHVPTTEWSGKKPKKAKKKDEA